MPVILCHLPQSPIGGQSSANISSDIAVFDAGEIIGGTDYTGALARHSLSHQLSRVITTRISHSLNSHFARSYGRDYFQGVHIAPTDIALGNVVSAQTETVYVWNAEIVSQTLSEIEGLDEGLELSGQASPPLLFHPREEKQWTLAITPRGASVIDAAIAFQFNGGDQATLAVTGSRIVAFSWLPDWANPVVETLSWLTDILQSESYVEQRRALRATPRRQFSFSLYAQAAERRRLELALFGWGGQAWALPIYPDVQRLTEAVPAGSTHINCTLSHFELVQTTLALLRGKTDTDYEVVEIESTDESGINLSRETLTEWPAGTQLYPARSARLVEQPSITRLTDELVRLDVEFRIDEVSHWDTAEFEMTYRSYPVLLMAPDESENLTHQFNRLQLTLDNDQALPQSYDSAQLALPQRGYRWRQLERAARSELRGQLYALYGRQKAIWVPTHGNDMVLLSEISAGSSALDIEWMGYTRHALGETGMQDILITLRNGTQLIRRITGATETSNTVERLTVNEAFENAIDADDIRRICFMALMRLNSDSIELQHLTDGDGIARCNVTFTGVRDDEF